MQLLNPNKKNNRYAWLVSSVVLAFLAVGLTLVPWPPLSIVGGLALLTLLPGMQLTHWLGLWHGWQSIKSMVLSIALGLVVSPLLLFWSGWLFGMSRLETLLVPVLFIVLMGWVNSRFQFESLQATGRGPFKVNWPIVAILLLLAASIILVYTEGETGLGSYPIQMGDWVKHHGVTWSLRHTGVPPADMFFTGMAPDETLSYYYFFHLTAASLDILHGGPANVSGMFVVMAVVASLCFALIFYWLACVLFQNKRAAMAAFLFVTFIGGLDIIPTLRQVFRKEDVSSVAEAFRTSTEHIDNWTPPQHLRLSTFVTHYFWVPQHITGLLVVALGLYLYRVIPDRQRLLPVMGLLVASLLGHSTWVAMIVFIALFLFALFQIFSAWRQGGKRKARDVFLAYAVISLVAIIAILPFALTLLGSGTTQAGIAFEIPHNLTDWSLLTPFSTGWPGVIGQLLDIPIHYFVEMGVLLVGGLIGLWIFWRQKKPEPVLPFLILMLVIGFGAITFFAAGRAYTEFEIGGRPLILNNDLGLRAIMPAQMALALFAGYYLSHVLRRGRWQLVIIMPLILLGLTSSLWEVLAMGVNKYKHPPAVPNNVLQTFAELPKVTPLFSVVQHRVHDDFSRVQPGYADRFNGYSTSEAISVSNVAPLNLALALELSRQAFENTLAYRSYQMFLGLGADFVFVGPVEQKPEYSPEKFEYALYFSPTYQGDDVAVYGLQSLLPGEAQATFDDGTIEYLGYFVDPHGHAPGQEERSVPAFVSAWQLTRPADKNYTAFIHLVDAEGNVVAQADHQLWAWDVTTEGPTSIWTPDLPHLDMVPIPEQALAAGGPLMIRLGLWLPDTGQQFPVETSTSVVDEGGRLILGEIGP
jgi:hypothetical protein